MKDTPLTVTANGVTVPIFQPGHGARHALLISASKARRESFLLELIASAKASGSVTTWLARRNAENSPMEQAESDRDAADVADVRRMIEDAWGFMIANLAAVAEGETDRDLFEPTVERRLLLLVLDIPLTDPEIAWWVATIARRGRRGGVALAVASEDGTLKSLGGSPGSVIRDVLAQDAVITLDVAE